MNDHSFSKYHETSLTGLSGGSALKLSIGPPKPMPHARRRSTNGKRIATAHRRQLVCLAVDDSGSMRHDGKAAAATKACTDMLFEMEIRSRHGRPLFDVALFAFGDCVFADDDHLCRPCTEIDPATVKYRGTSGGTKIIRAMSFLEELLEQYEDLYLRHHSQFELDAHPVPLIILLSDGYDGDRDPLPIANRIKSMPLSIGLPPIIVTVGIEYGGDQPDVDLLCKLASMDDRRPLYFDISDADLLSSFLATVGSSGVSTPRDVLNAAITVNPKWGT